MDLEFLKNRYDFELQRKEQLTAALGFPVAVLSGLGGAIVAMAQSFTYSGELLTRSFLIALGLDVAAFLVCLVCLGLVYHRQGYLYLERLGQLDEWRKSEARAPRTEANRRDLDARMDAYLRCHIIKAADWNAVNNDRRSANLDWARNTLLAVLFFTFIASWSYVVDQVRYSHVEEKESTGARPTH